METTVPALLDHVAETPAATERTRARQVLIEFGEAAPAVFARALTPCVDRLVDLSTADDADTRGCAAGFLSYVAERDPTAVSATTGRLIRLLDDSDPWVRANAALALGLCGTDEAKDALVALDPDETFVEDAVEQALARLE